MAKAEPQARRPRTVFRSLDGILLLDKPPGMSSNQALQRARHLFRAEKAGHTGSLDPLATGLLPLCFGEATKLAGYLLGNDKTYETTARLGQVTDTDDADGQVLRERPVPAMEESTVQAALQRFIGCISQRPPVYSALKQGGEPLYAKARRGDAIEVPEREVSVHSIELLELGQDFFRLRIKCGSGTYVRSIVRDLGETLGCGAHVTALRRTWIEPFTNPRMYPLDALFDLARDQGEAALEALVLPIEVALAGWPGLRLDAAQAAALGQGQPVQTAMDAGGPLNLLDPAGRSLGIGEIDVAGLLRSRRLFRWSARG